MSEQQVAEERAKFVGGSDIAAVVGLSPWKTPVALYDAKVAPKAPAESKTKRRTFNRGKVWEKVVAEMLVQRLEEDGRTVEVVTSNTRYVDPAVPYFACEIDFELRLDGASEITNVELKTVHPFKSREWGEEETDECPVHYAAQALWGLGITGRNECIVAALFGADEIRLYPVRRDDATIEWLRASAKDFWELHVQPRRPPRALTVDDYARLYPVSHETIAEGDEEIKRKVMQYNALSAEIEARTAERDLVEFDLKGFMRDADTLRVPGVKTPVATWKSRAWTSFDFEGLKEAHPQIHRQFVRKGASRQFSVKSFKP